MTLNELKEVLRSLTMAGLSAIAGSSFGIDGCRRAIAYYDTRKDEVVTALASFPPAVEGLAGFPAVSTLFGSGEARRIAIQFVFNACRHVGDSITPETAFERVWDGFARELDTATWTFAAVANMQNVECLEEKIDLVDGISIVGRSFEKLAALLNWGPPELDYLVKDWMEGGGQSSFVLTVQKQVPKSPENFLSTDDGTQYLRATRALLALRLLAPGDVRIGRLS